MATEPRIEDDAVEIYKQLEVYPWNSDKEFLGGLSAILGPDPNPSQINDLTLRAQCFYLSRKKSIPIDFNGYKAYLSSQPQNSSTSPSTAPDSANMSVPKTTPASQPIPATSPAAPHPREFLHIVELIQSGKPIPGIREIPDGVAQVPGSTPVLPKRKKPWEKELPDTTEGTFGDRRDYYIEQELPEDEATKEDKGKGKETA